MRKFCFQSRQALLCALLLLATLCLLTQCKKQDLHTPEEKIEIKQAISNAMIQKGFNDADLVPELIDTLNDSLQVIYTPDWNKIRISKMSDSVDYRFIPLKAIAKTKSGEYPVKLNGYSSFLLVKNGKKFYRSRFYPKPVGQITSESYLFLYNGQLILDDLTSTKSYVVDYRMGKTSQNFVDKLKLSENHGSSSKISAKKMSVNTTMGWEQQCYQASTCNWYSACGGIVYIDESLPGTCSYPTNVTPCDYSAPWEQSSNSTYRTVCEYVYFEDPPVDGGGGGSPGTNPTPAEGFRPLCITSLKFVPSTNNTKDLHLNGVKFGITDIPLIGKPKTNTITFDVYLNIPYKIKDPDDGSKTHTFTDAELQNFVYESYHYASQITNQLHGQDFFSVGAQPKYSAQFVQSMVFYLNFIALQGIFKHYENMHEGVVPAIGASGNTKTTPSKATTAVYTNGPSGRGC
jgi:hypothetical protein